MLYTVRLSGAPIPVRESGADERVWLGGTANRLSDEQVVYPRIDRMHAATKVDAALNARDWLWVGCNRLYRIVRSAASAEVAPEDGARHSTSYRGGTRRTIARSPRRDACVRDATDSF